MELQFSSLEELYERVKPALTCKKEEMKRAGYEYIEIEDLWNYLKETKWKRAQDLLLYQMVDDIMDVEVLQVDAYLKKKLGKQTRKLYFEE